VAHEDLKAAIARAIDDQMAREHASPAGPTKTIGFIGRSSQIKQILSLVPLVGWSEAPVLIQGETGSGKEVLARELHANSPRADGPFLKLNCAALPSELVESELFGYERGAFTGAFQKKAGMFEMASRGTILLDEIGDMDVRLQAKLLHVLQDHEFQRIGGKEMVKVNVRVIAATHQDLERAIGERRFREDLYYRLNVINLQLPPLRERKDDILPLAQHLIGKHSPAGTPALNITMDLTHALLAYHWPGNVRELENVMRRLIVLRNPALILNELKERIAHKPPAAAPIGGSVGGPSETGLDGGDPTPILEQVTKAKQQAEAEAILAALNSTHWNRKQAAALLKIDYKALLYKMKKLGVEDDVVPIAGSTNESPSRAAVAGG
jgi:transcriptional regulator with PAS, ATPase and Fis domain